MECELGGFPGGSGGKESACNARDLCQEDPLEKGVATHSSILAWKIPCAGAYTLYGLQGYMLSSPEGQPSV